MKKKTLFVGMTIILLTLALASCGPRTTPEPTADVSLLATNAAQTIEARFTETAMAMPTNTPEPTYTPVSLTPTAQAIPQLPTAGINPAQPATAPTTANQPVVLPTATLSAVGNKAAYVGQSIKDGTHFKAGESADMIWYFTNVGTTTWTTDYSIRFYVGSNFAKAGNTRYKLPKEVKPQEDGQAVIDIVAPNKAGEYKMSWVLSDDGDNNFFIVDLTIIVD